MSIINDQNIQYAIKKVGSDEFGMLTIITALEYAQKGDDEPLKMVLKKIIPPEILKND